MLEQGNPRDDFSVDDYCANLVRDIDRDRFLSSLFAPARARPALLALYAFDIEIARIASVVREPMAGEVRMRWWYDIVQGTDRDQATGSPVAEALVKAMTAYDLPEQPLADLIEAHRFDLYHDPVETLADLTAYAADTGVPMFELPLRVLAPEQAVPSALIRHAGIASSLVRLLAAFPYHVVHGRLFVPNDLLKKHKSRAEDVLAHKRSPALDAALSELRSFARGHLAEARNLIAHAPQATWPAFLPLALGKPLLARMERRGYDPFQLLELSPWRRQWILWRASRNLGKMV